MRQVNNIKFIASNVCSNALSIFKLISFINLHYRQKFEINNIFLRIQKLRKNKVRIFFYLKIRKEYNEIKIYENIFIIYKRI